MIFAKRNLYNLVKNLGVGGGCVWVAALWSKSWFGYQGLITWRTSFKADPRVSIHFLAVLETGEGWSQKQKKFKYIHDYLRIKVQLSIDKTELYAHSTRYR